MKPLLHLILFILTGSLYPLYAVAQDQNGQQVENAVLAQGIQTFFDGLVYIHKAATPDVSALTDYIETNFREDAKFVDRFKKAGDEETSEERKTRGELVASVEQAYPEMYDLGMDYSIKNISYEDGGLVASVDYQMTLKLSSDKTYQGKTSRTNMVIISDCKSRFAQEREKVLGYGWDCDSQATYEKPVPIP